MEAQRFPTDYDGILAGAPANNWTALLTDRSPKNTQVADGDVRRAYIPATKLPAITAAVMAANATRPRAMASRTASLRILDKPASLNPADAAMQSGRTPTTCLTAPQVKTHRRPSMQGVRVLKDGKRIFPWFSCPAARRMTDGWSPVAHVGSQAGARV